MTTTQSLKGLLKSLSGYQILTATLGTNGNGGCMSDADSMMEHADNNDYDFSDYDVTEFDWSELCDHWTDATTDPIEDAGSKSDWIAFECHHEDEQGYLTGSVTRVYINTEI